MSSNQYTAEFEAEAVKQVIDRGHTVVEVAARLCLPKHTLYDCVHRAGKASAQPARQPSAPGESAEVRCNGSAGDLSPVEYEQLYALRGQ